MRFPGFALASLSLASLFAGSVFAQEFPNSQGVRGLTFRDGQLWGASANGELVEIDPDTGMVLSTVPISGVLLPFGLGWDATRGAFIVTEAIGDTVNLVAPDGTLVMTIPAPGGGPVGAAYDPVRDGYWIADWEAHRLDLIDGTTHTVSMSLPAPLTAGRIAGVGFDSNNNALVINSRDTAETYVISADTGATINSVPTPPNVPGYSENGQGAAVRPDTLQAFVSHFEEQQIFGFDVGLTMPECFLVLGPGAGSAEFSPALHTFTTQLSEVERFSPVTMQEPGYIIFPWTGLFGPVNGPVVATFSAQILMWNPEVFPATPERWSYRLDVTIYNTGAIHAIPSGVPGGIRMGARLGYNDQGRPIVQFPFLVHGL